VRRSCLQKVYVLEICCRVFRSRMPKSLSKRGESFVQHMDVCKSCSYIIEPGTLRLSPFKDPLLFPSYPPSNCTFPMPRDYVSRQRERLLLATCRADRLGHALYQVGAFFGRSAFGRSALRNANIHCH
jgi:hypothetical protein